MLNKLGLETDASDLTPIFNPCYTMKTTFNATLLRQRSATVCYTRRFLTQRCRQRLSPGSCSTNATYFGCPWCILVRCCVESQRRGWRLHAPTPTKFRQQLCRFLNAFKNLPHVAATKSSCRYRFLTRQCFVQIRLV